MYVSELESYLLNRFPKTDAESWDHVGLSAGDPSLDVAGVLCALDATERNVIRAHEMHANVLLTHHPVYIKAPDAFSPSSPNVASCSAAVYTAIKLGVSIISLHTNLDRSIEARTCLGDLLGVDSTGSLEFPDDASAPGLGLLGDVPRLSLKELVHRCADTFDTEPRVWGDPHATISKVAILGGSLGSLGESAISQHADAIICGEAGYHICQDLTLRGMNVILLGHDRSEQPFVGILADAARDAGVHSSKVNIMDGSQKQWWTEIKQGECS